MKYEYGYAALDPRSVSIIIDEAKRSLRVIENSMTDKVEPRGKGGCF